MVYALPTLDKEFLFEVDSVNKVRPIFLEVAIRCDHYTLLIDHGRHHLGTIGTYFAVHRCTL